MNKCKIFVALFVTVMLSMIITQYEVQAVEYDYTSEYDLDDEVYISSGGIVKIGEKISMIQKHYKNLGTSVIKFSYDEFGRVSTKEYYSSNYDKEPSDVWYYTYDDGNRLIQTIALAYGEEHLYTYAYDEYNRRIRKEDYWDDKVGITTYEYDAIGNMVRRYITGNLFIYEKGEEYIYTYNEKNQLVKTETPSYNIEYHYDDLGRLIYADDSLGDYFDKTYTYDENGNATISSNSEWSHIYSFDEQGRIVGDKNGDRYIEYIYLD